jgi:hypothetical protein
MILKEIKKKARRRLQKIKKKKQQTMAKREQRETLLDGTVMCAGELKPRGAV